MTPSSPTVAASAPLSARARSMSRLAAGLGLGLLGGVLAMQMMQDGPSALGAGLGAAVVAFASWGPIALKNGTVKLGGAALVGVLAVVAGYVGMALGGGVTSRLVGDTDAGVALLFSVWMVLPICSAFAIGVAVATRLLTAPKSDVARTP